MKKTTLSYEETIHLFIVTIFAGVIGLLVSIYYGNFIFLFLPIIPGTIIDCLRFAAEWVKAKERHNEEQMEGNTKD